MSGKKRTKNPGSDSAKLNSTERVESQFEAQTELEFNFSDDQGAELNQGAEAEAEVDIAVQDTEGKGFLPEPNAEEELDQLSLNLDLGGIETSQDLNRAQQTSFAGSELAGYDSAEIVESEFVSDEVLTSVIESVLFASDRPVSLASLKLVFKGTNVKSDKIRRAIEKLAVEYAGASRGVVLEEVTGGYQLRTKSENVAFLRRTLKSKSFRLSGPALEVLSIVAYKQPCVKYEIDEIRGVESGHLLRALMEKGLVSFEGKSDLPGRPMQYGTTKKFLEIFGLRNLKELPTLSEMDQLIPEGIGDDEPVEKQSLSNITDSMAESVGQQYSSGEEELLKIEEQLGEIETSSQFFEEEKKRQREKRDHERAQNIREALVMEEPVSTRDRNWLKKFDEAASLGKTLVQIEEEAEKARIEAMKKTRGSELLTSEEGEILSLDVEEGRSLASQLESLSEISGGDLDTDSKVVLDLQSGSDIDSESEGEENSLSEYLERDEEI